MKYNFTIISAVSIINIVLFLYNNKKIVYLWVKYKLLYLIIYIMYKNIEYKRVLRNN